MRFHWIILFLSGLIMIAIGCSGGGKRSNLHYVEYEVSTSITDQTVSISYLDENGMTIDLQNVTGFDKGNWIYTFTTKSGAHLRLSAMLNGDIDGTIHATIRVDYNPAIESLNYFHGIPAIAEYTIPSD
jgi:hypothetical protein